MNLFERIKDYIPTNEQEKIDQKVMLQYMLNNDDCLYRDNLIAHFTVSIWTVNRERTKTLMVYHNIYDSWSWIGGHADGESELSLVALRELQEETGVSNAVLVSEDIFSLETLMVKGHVRRGKYVPSHLHFNVTYLAEADENETLVVNEEENKGVRWCTFDEALELSKEPWMIEHVYKKLIKKIESKNLPIGIVNKVELQVETLDINDGDIIVMCTDGILDSKEDNPEWIEDFLKNITTNNVQKISDLLLAEAVDNSYGVVRDDMSIIVSKIVKRK